MRTVLHCLPPKDWTEPGFMGLGMIYTAMPVTNAVPAVVARRPGIVDAGGPAAGHRTRRGLTQRSRGATLVDRDAHADRARADVHREHRPMSVTVSGSICGSRAVSAAPISSAASWLSTWCTAIVARCSPTISATASTIAACALDTVRIRWDSTSRPSTSRHSSGLSDSAVPSQDAAVPIGRCAAGCQPVHDDEGVSAWHGRPGRGLDGVEVGTVGRRTRRGHRDEADAHRRRTGVHHAHRRTELARRRDWRN